MLSFFIVCDNLWYLQDMLEADLNGRGKNTETESEVQSKKISALQTLQLSDAISTLGI